MIESMDKCILCGSSNLIRDNHSAKTLNLMEPLSVSVCKECKIRFLNPRPSFKTYREIYSSNNHPLLEAYPIKKNHYSKTDTFRKEEYRIKLNRIKRKIPSGKLLEIGSCTGAFLNEAQKSGFDAVGIEPSKENAIIAKEKYDITLKVGTIEEFDFDNNSFDIIFSSHVFEHLLDPQNVFKKLCNWLKPGGYIIIEVPNQFETFGEKRRRLFNTIIKRNRTFASIHHPIFFSPKTLKFLVKNNGCKLCSLRNIYYEKHNFKLNIIIKRAMALIFGGINIEITAQKKL